MKQRSLGASRSPSPTRSSILPPRASVLPPRSSLFPPASDNTQDRARDAWLEYEERIRLAPESGSVRGMFFREVQRLSPQLTAGRGRYVPFSSYPMREYMSVLLAGARASHPRSTPAEALRLMGHSVYEAFANSLAGKSLFGIIQHEYVRVLELTPKAYPLTMQPGRVEVIFESDTKAIAQLRDVWPFPESFHLGIWEGAYKALSVLGHVEMVPLTVSSVDLHLTWDPSSVRGPLYSKR